MFSKITDDAIGITRQRELSSEFPIIQAVIDGSQGGQIFANVKNDIWILHKAGFSEAFLYSDAGVIELIDFIGCESELPTYFHIYNCPEKLIEAFKRQSDLTVRVRKRIQLVCDQTHDSEVILSDRDAFSVSPVTHDNFDSLSNLNLDFAQKFWEGKEEFVNKALAVCAFNRQNNPISICYAASVAGAKAEIDVFTVEAWRGRGLAKRVVQAFKIECGKIGIVPNWDCFEDNYASLMTAKSLNFTPNLTYNFISIFKKNEK